MITLATFATLYAAFRVKHFLCDFVLQTPRMARDKADGDTVTLFLHSSVHAAGTLVIVLFLAPTFWWLAPLDLIIHYQIDGTKSVFGRRYAWSPNDAQYWWAFGLDQEAHNFTHFAYILAIVYRI